VVMSSSVGTMEAESPPLVRSSESVGGADVQEPGGEEPSYS
jgi:hypothetical protein